MRTKMMPLETCQGFKIHPGFFLMPGTTLLPGGVNFTMYSKDATSAELVFYNRGENNPFASIPFTSQYRVGNVFSMFVFDLDIDDLEYGFVVSGEWAPEKGLLFDKNRSLLDPRARLVTGRDVWGRLPDPNNNFQLRGMIGRENFEWGHDTPMKTPHNELIIYELHVRGYTKDISSNVGARGTYKGLMQKIPYLKDLGITAVELMPIFEFDEFDGLPGPRISPEGKPLYNYWGYNTTAFFAPKAGYAATGKIQGQKDEFKTLVKKMHEAGIKVILDVVFNHTGEGNEEGPIISFKGFDNKNYYILEENGKYKNFSGCGNTFNCNNPLVRKIIRDCLKYWVIEYHVDGFRFDLASILSRDKNGEPIENPPLLEEIAVDPVLADTILIAEAWDAAGLYQVGTFPAYGRWAEWNGRYRDDMRRFLKGDAGFAKATALRMTGSEDIYSRKNRGELASINFITCHDGFTLNDLYSYNEKHNYLNGWGGTDGGNDNFSWNAGWEGETDNPEINALRLKMQKNAIATLLVSRGIPMLLAGDEFSNTQYGNNNPYCQDNEISWLNWHDLEKNQELFNFTKRMIAFRKAHPVLKYVSIPAPENYPSISFHGENAWQFEENFEDRVLGIMFAGETDGEPDFIYIGMNMHWEPHKMWLPELPKNYHWEAVADTSYEKDSFFKESKRISVGAPRKIEPRSVFIAVCAPNVGTKNS